jgi:hypothetical protein
MQSLAMPRGTTMPINYLTPFADWLSLSFPASISPHSELVCFLNSLSPLIYKDLGVNKHLYKSTLGGTFLITEKDSFVSVSISGGLLSMVRNNSKMNEFQQILASAPHNITRLDIAYDVPIPGHVSISRIRKLYPNGFAVVANRARQLQYILNQLNETSVTGTAYFQTTKYKGTIKLRVYDKEHEAHESRNEILPPTTRYELTIGRGASLKDFSTPSSAFWHFLPKELLPRPKDTIKPWVATPRINYDEHVPRDTSDYQRLRFVINNHPALAQLIKEALVVDGGAMLFRSQVTELLEHYAKHLETKGNATELHD